MINCKRKELVDFHIQTLGPSETKSGSKSAQRIFNTIQSHFILHLSLTFLARDLQNFVPLTKNLGKWIRQRTGTADLIIWYHLADI